MRRRIRKRSICLGNHKETRRKYMLTGELRKSLEDEKEQNNEQDKQCTYNITLGGICVMFTSPQLSYQLETITT
jgi:hypothetical protein